MYGMRECEGQVRILSNIEDEGGKVRGKCDMSL